VILPAINFHRVHRARAACLRLAFVLLFFVVTPAGAAESQLRIAGLQQPVEILRDRWGIAHIYAQTEEDLFFAQGYNAARDRLFQFELWRMQATGTAAQAFGARELQRDIGARLHRYRGDLDEEFRHYHPRGRQIVEAFVRGVNAWIEQTERDPGLLPVEFGLLGLKPGRWTPEVVISRHQGLLGNLGTEVDLARAIAQVGEAKVRRLYSFQPTNALLVPDPSVDLAAIPADVIGLYAGFRRRLEFTPEDIASEHRADAATHAAMTASDSQAATLLLEPNSGIGSNNWVIHGSRTVGRHPIMANDPHRAITAPSLRYWVHLVGPGWNVIGAGEPVLPGVSIGHNENGAWGLTIFGSDSEDLYVYDTHPTEPDKYRYKGKWESMRVERDTITVKGAPEERVEYKFTRHGPVLFEDKAAHKAYALRAAWREPGGAPYLASLRMAQARNWEEFREACTYNHTPSESMVWADRNGHIGFQASGIQPLRRNWSGLLPVPGDGRYEWDGYLPIRELPNENDPERGFIATANSYLFPADYPRPEALNYLWDDAFRLARISEVLGSGRLFDVAAVMRLQNDDLSIPARQLVPLLDGIELDGESARARDLLLKWDYVLDKDSVPATIFVQWQERLHENFRNLVLVDEAERALEIEAYTSRLVDQLIAPDALFGADPFAGRDELVAHSLRQAVADLSQMLGPDMEAWKYGQEKFHHVIIRHPLSAAVDAEMRSRLDVGPAPRGGDGNTVSATGGNPQTVGGSFKIIVDTADWDRSAGQNSPGQSGDPASPHYRDLFPSWAQGKYFPVLYSREKVEAAVSEKLTLTP
jgi:penicillin amidase